MNHPIRESLTNNKILKLVSLALGTCIWALLSQHQTENRWIEIPICFYNVPEHLKVNARQEIIKVQLRGKKTDLNLCDTVGLHIDASDFKPGQLRICPNEQLLFLPQSVKLMNSKPLYLEIIVA